MLLLLPPGVERRTGNTKTVTDTGNAVGSAGARRDRGSHYRDLRRTKGPTCPTRARKTSFSIVSSPIRFIAAASSSLAASPSRSRNDPSIPDSARRRQRSRWYSLSYGKRGRATPALASHRTNKNSRSFKQSVVHEGHSFSVPLDNVVSKETGASSFGVLRRDNLIFKRLRLAGFDRLGRGAGRAWRHVQRDADDAAARAPPPHTRNPRRKRKPAVGDAAHLPASCLLYTSD